MLRYETVEYDDASPEVREVYDDFLRSTGSFSLPNWMKSLGGSGPLARAYWERAKGTLAHGHLPPLLKELVIFVVSVVNGSAYCSACHAHGALRLDPLLTFDDLMQLTRDIDASDRPPAQRAALKLAAAMAHDPDSVGDDQFRALAAAGYGRQDVAELLSAIDLAVMFNTYTKAIRLPLDPEYRPVLDDGQRDRIAC